MASPRGSPVGVKVHLSPPFLAWPTEPSLAKVANMLAGVRGFARQARFQVNSPSNFRKAEHIITKMGLFCIPLPPQMLVGFPLFHRRVFPYLLAPNQVGNDSK